MAQGDPAESAARLLRDGRPSAALEQAGPALARNPNDARLLTLAGLAYSMEGRDDEALVELQRALNVEPSMPAALRAEAQILSRRERPDAVPVLEQILRLAPEDPVAREMLALAEARQGNCEAALGSFRMVSEVLRAHPDSLARYGGCLFTEGHYTEAVSAFSQLLLLQPGNPAGRYDLALAQWRSGKNEEAARTIRPLLDQADVDTLLLAADIFEDSGRTPDAVAAARKAIVLDPSQPGSYMSFAELCMLHESYAVGIDMVSAGLARLPRSSSLYLARGMLYAGLARYGEAETDFRTAQALDPGRGTGAYGVGLVEAQGHRPSEALATTRAALLHHPDDAQLNFLLARLLLESGARPATNGFPEAEEAAERAVNLNPALVPARDLLARIYGMSGRTAGEIEQCRAALRLDPGDVEATYRLLRAAREAGDVETLRSMAEHLRAMQQESRQDEATRLRYRIVEVPAPAARPIKK